MPKTKPGHSHLDYEVRIKRVTFPAEVLSFS